MNEITEIILEHEMDLILAHKQSMKLAELTGLSLSVQTTFATAISEVSRNLVGRDKAATLILAVSAARDQAKYIIAILDHSAKEFLPQQDEGYAYAKKLVSNIKYTTTAEGIRIELSFRLPATTSINAELIERWRINLNTDPSVSPYEEIKRKNRQLIDLADKLRESEQQYKSLADSLPIMIFTLSDSGAITYANQWLLDYTGMSIQKLNETQWQTVLHPEDFESISPAGQDNRIQGSVTQERRFRDSKSGIYRWHTGVMIAMKSEDGTVKCWNSFMVDMHAQKLIEQTLKDNFQLKEIQAELEDKVELLNRSNQQLEQFAYIASHDLQEPLRKISYYCDYLKTKFGSSLNSSALVYFDNIISATGRMKNLINDILLYSTINKEELLGPVALNEVMESVLLDLDLAINTSDASITYSKLPSVKGNYSQIKQLFANLISNSIKYIEPGVRPVILVSAAITGNAVLLSVKDNGIGFEMHFLDRMFSLFQRLHTKDKYGGTGIGLAICKKIVDFHNGTITAISTPGNGATFIVSLPL